MKDKVIYYLQFFTSKDLNRFRDFLISPFFNKREKIVVLFDFIRKKCLGPAGKDLNEEAAFNLIYKGEKFTVNKIRKLKAALLELLLKYMSINSFDRSEVDRNLHLLKELNRIEDNTYFEQYHKKAIESIKSSSEKDFLIFDKIYYSEAELIISQQRSGIRLEEHTLKSLLSTLGTGILLKLFKMAHIARNLNRTTGKYDLPEWSQSFLDIIEEKDLPDENLAKIYYFLYQSIAHPEKITGLHTLKDLVIQNQGKFSSSEGAEIYTVALNSFYRQTTITGDDLLNTVLDLYKSFYADLILSEKMQMTPFHFKNMVSIASRLGEFEWVEAFMEEAAPFLMGGPDKREVALLFNKGVWLFYQKKYEESESMFNKVMPLIKDVFYELDSRAYLLMIHYETGNTMGMESLVHSFRMFLTRSEEISDSHRNLYNEFIRLYRRLISVPPRDEGKANKLKEEIGRADISSGKAWLVKKLDELVGA